MYFFIYIIYRCIQQVKLIKKNQKKNPTYASLLKIVQIVPLKIKGEGLTCPTYEVQVIPSTKKLQYLKDVQYY